jgi:hypothetical protein
LGRIGESDVDDPTDNFHNTRRMVRISLSKASAPNTGHTAIMFTCGSTSLPIYNRLEAHSIPYRLFLAVKAWTRATRTCTSGGNRSTLPTILTRIPKRSNSSLQIKIRAQPVRLKKWQQWPRKLVPSLTNF